MKNVLFIVYYFPPMGGSGVQRPLKFVKYLRAFGWNPIILCPEPGIYSVFDESLQQELDEISPEMVRVQAKTPFHVGGKSSSPKQVQLPEFATELSRRFLRLFMYPDNKKGWIQPAISAAEKLIQEKQIDVIFSTAPPFSNHIIGTELKKKFNIPLILDYRDAWQNNHFFSEMFNWQKRKMYTLEEKCLKAADAIIGLDDYILKEMDELFPNIIKQKKVIAHGFDPDDFMHPGKANLSYKAGKLNMLYSGLFYEQNQPDVFLKGIKLGMDKKLFTKKDIHLHFQGGLSKRIKELIQTLCLDDNTSDYGYLNHDVAASNISQADLLWMISNFDPSYKQVKSGKLFEYFGSGKPILGLVNPGVEADLLKNYSAGFVVDVNSSEIIAQEIKKILSMAEENKISTPDQEFVNQFNREKLTEKLSELFNDISK